MPEFSLIALYVDSPEKSAAFYRGLLGRDPIEQSDTFVMFPLRDGAALGLWSRHTVAPAAQAGGGGTELCFTRIRIGRGARGLAGSRPSDRAAAHRDGVRPHLRGARPGRPPAPGVQAVMNAAPPRAAAGR